MVTSKKWKTKKASITACIIVSYKVSIERDYKTGSQEVAGSSPASSTKISPCKCNVYKGFLLFFDVL